MNKMLVFLLFALCQAFVFAQQQKSTPYYKGFQQGHAIYHWTTSNGLPQSHVSGIAQTANKLIWLATYDGVVHFDGWKFTRVAHRFREKEVSNFITTIAAFEDTVAWASNQEIVIYAHNAIQAVYPIKKTGIFVFSIVRDADRYYFLAHDQLFTIENGKLAIVYTNKEIAGKDGCVTLTSVMHRGKLVSLMLMPDKQTALYTYDPKTKTGKFAYPTVPVENLTVRHNTLLLFSKNKWMEATKALQPGKVRFQSSLPGGDPHIHSGIYNDYSFYYDRSTIEIARYDAQVSRLDMRGILFGNELFASFVDHSGNLWMGTNSLGLFMIRHYPFSYFGLLDNKLITNSSHSFVDRNGLLWFDNDCDVTVAIDPKDGSIQHRLRDVCHWVDADWSEDSVALFSFGIGHHWYNKRTGQLSPISNLDVSINSCYEMAPRKLILGTFGGLMLWDGKKAVMWKKFRSKNTICNQVLEYQKGCFYFATTEGVYHFRNNKWEWINGDGLLEKSDFRSLSWQEKKGYLYIGTAGNGILRYNTRTKKMQQLTYVPEELKNCWSMVEDQYHQLWITSNNGIVQINLKDLERSFDHNRYFVQLNHYRYETGLDNVEFNSRTQNKGRLLPNGKIVFSSLAGPVTVTPHSNWQFNQQLAGILLEEILVNQQPLSDPVTSLLELKEGDFVQIQFTLPSFSIERLLEFEYRIKGYRKEWSRVQSRQITLDNLPAGDYQLEIRIVSGKRSLQLPVHVKPKHPNAWMVYLLIALILATIVVFITVAVTKWVQRRKHAANSLKQQLKILEMEALRSQMNPHFIFNCLNTIQFLFISGNVDRANRYLSDFSTLMRMTLDLLRTPVTTLDVELKAMMLYIKLEELQFDDGFELRMINRLETPENQIKTPTLFLQIFIENAILHGLKKTTAQHPILTIILEETPTHFIFRVCDNGPGLSATREEGHKSVGLAMLRERFALKNEIYNWNIDFVMHEHETPENDIRTEIIITFGKTPDEPAE